MAGLTNKVILGDTSPFSPSLASHDGRLFIAWRGDGNDNLNIAEVALFGNSAGGFEIEWTETKR